MKKIKKTQAHGFYVFQGEVAANSNFIETLDEAKRFLIYAKYFLKGFLTVYDYNITRHEWHMVVKLKSAEEICKRSTELESDSELVWRIVSERVRLFLSIYVRVVNKMRGRTGTLVHSPYERYYFEGLQEAIGVIDKIRQQTFRMYRRKRKYRGVKTHYRIPRKLGQGSIFLCSKEVKRGEGKVRKNLEAQWICDFGNLVLLKSVISTQNLHITQSNSIFYPKRE